MAAAISKVFRPGKHKKSLRENMRRDFYGQLNLYYIDSFRAFRTLFNIEAYSLTFGESFETVTLDRRVVNKNIAALFRSDKPITLRFIEPLHFSFSQLLLPPY